MFPEDPRIPNARRGPPPPDPPPSSRIQQHLRSAPVQGPGISITGTGASTSKARKKIRTKRPPPNRRHRHSSQAQAPHQLHDLSSELTGSTTGTGRRGGALIPARRRPRHRLEATGRTQTLPTRDYLHARTPSRAPLRLLAPKRRPEAKGSGGNRRRETRSGRRLLFASPKQ